MKQELMSLGLTNNEAIVYLALLETGSTNAGEIIKKTKLHRNIVYDNLERLIEKGLVSFVLIKNIKYFETTSPKELKEYIEKQKREIVDKEKIVNQIIPEIDKKRSFPEKKQEAIIFKGKKGLKTILEEITKSKTEFLTFGTGWGMKQTMGDYYGQWHLKLMQNKIKSRILLPINKKNEYIKPYEARYLPNENIMPSTICIFEDKVLNIIWGEDPIAVLITSEKVSSSYKSYFEMLWKIAKK
ncbi:MAG: TrmB family transcriptional regulator [Nanoarchaeota archaeon]